MLQCCQGFPCDHTKNSMPHTIRYALAYRFFPSFDVTAGPRGGEGSSTVVDQSCGSICGILSQACANSVSVTCVQNDLQQISDKTNGMVLLHVAQNDLHKLRRQVHLLIDHERLPQHHHSRMHFVLRRQGPQCRCGGSPGLVCRYCQITNVSEWCGLWIASKSVLPNARL